MGHGAPRFLLGAASTVSRLLVKSWRAVSGGLRRALDQLVPQRLDERSRVRSLFFARAWVVALTFAALSAFFFGVTGLWLQLAALGPLLLTGPVLLVLHHRGIRFEPLVHVSLAAVSLAFGLGALAEVHSDHTSLALILLVPMLATFLLGKRGGLVWLGISLLWGGYVTFAQDHGWIAGSIDRYSVETHLVKLMLGLGVAWRFAQTFEAIREEANERLLEADRLRRSFLANVSHEIRTPMNGVLGMTDVMLLSELTPEHREQLLTIQRSGRTLVALIDELLDLSKMEAGKLSLQNVDFNLDSLLADVRALAGATAKAKGLDLEIYKDPAVPALLHGDDMRLGQVLMNLVGNAVKFTERGQVRVEVSRRPASAGVGCCFAVTDSGPGISSEAQARLFNAFEQVDASTTRQHGGTGLGLALSQQIVTRMGGRIELESKLGAGSRFSFTVVFPEASEVQPTVAVKATPPASLGTVLVVDDNELNLRVGEALCEKLGYVVETATNGPDAVASVQRQRFSVVLMDVHMAGMDGFEATRRIRALPGARGATPIVGLTGSAMPEELAECLRVGMNAALVKPVRLAEFKSTLDQFATSPPVDRGVG